MNLLRIHLKGIYQVLQDGCKYMENQILEEVIQK